MRRRSFTLIELLVVITVISILSGILLPTLVKVREVVKTTMCINNNKQILQASYMYAGDSDGFVQNSFDDWLYARFHLADANGKSGVASTYYMTMIIPKYSNAKIYECPGRTAATKRPVLTETRPASYELSNMEVTGIIKETGKIKFRYQYVTCYSIRSYTNGCNDIAYSRPLNRVRLGDKPQWCFVVDHDSRGWNFAWHCMRTARVNEYGRPQRTGYNDKSLCDGTIVVGDQDGAVRTVERVNAYYNSGHPYYWNDAFNRDNVQRAIPANPTQHY